MEVSLAALLRDGSDRAPHGGARCANRPPPRSRGPTRPESLLLVRSSGWAGRSRRGAPRSSRASSARSWRHGLPSISLRRVLPAGDTRRQGRGRADRVLLGSRDSLAAASWQRPWQFEMEWIVALLRRALLPVLLLPGSGALGMRGRAAGFPALVLVCIRSGWRCSRPIAAGVPGGPIFHSLVCRSPSRSRWPGSRRSVRGGSCVVLAGGLIAAALWTLPPPRRATRGR